jgi:hypothetical protein
MKKLLIIIALTASITANAHDRDIIPGLIIGSVIAGAILNNQRPQIIVQQAPQYPPQVISGRIYYQYGNERPTEYSAPYGYHKPTMTCGIDIQCQPAPVVCENIPVYLSNGAFAGYKQNCYQR